MSHLGPDERLRAADALVYVADLAAPTCSADDAHHLLDVLRLDDGASIVASDGRGRYRPCRLATEADRDRGRRRRGAALEPVGEATVEAGALPAAGEERTVAFALVKGDRSEWAVQKLTEVGVDRIVPLLTTRTVVRLDAAGAERRAARLRRVAREAAAQARRTVVPEVAAPLGLTRFLAGGAGGRPPAPGTVALAEPGGTPLTAATRCVVVGPEGGWTSEELDLVDTHLGLGPHVLRAETAAIVAGILLISARKSSLSVLTSG